MSGERQGRHPRDLLPHDALPMLDHRADMPALEEAQSPRIVKRFGRIAAGVLVLYVLAILILPWQQFVSGDGRVVAFDPLERPLVLEAPLSGRLLASNVVEGQAVRQGDVLFQMTDNDPNLLANLEAQMQASEVQLEAATEKLTQLRAQLRRAEASLPEAIAASDEKLAAARFAARTAELQYDRIQGLFSNPLGGLASERELEVAILERDRTAAALRQAEAERRQVELDGGGDLDKLGAELTQARGDSAAKAQSLAALRSRLNQTRTLTVVAPRDGVIYRVDATEGTFLSAGKPLATIVPETDRRVVELWLDGNDVPLVQPREVAPDGTVVQEGSPVRLQFEGWPAVQFIGWPSVARGTFGGEVLLIDPTDDGTGRFRVVVVPRPDTLDDGETVSWPGARWLRQGVQTRGWILLQRVPLWYEIWRQLNGFPPALQESPASTSGGAK
jgi:adhesin transport system membrane fusion protein